MKITVRHLRSIIREAVQQSRYRELGGKPLDRIDKLAKALAGAKNNGELYSINARLMRLQRPFQLADPIKRLRDGGILYAPTLAMLKLTQRYNAAQPVTEEMRTAARDEYLGMHASLSSNDRSQAAHAMSEIAAGGIVPGVKIVAHHEDAYALAARFLAESLHD